MKRRELITFVTVGCWAASSAVSFAQARAPKRIGWLSTAPHPFLEAFRRGLDVAGYTEGKDIQFVYSCANRDVRALPALAQGLANSAVDIIVSSARPPLRLRIVR